ncbi:MAG: acetyl-CoA carboxylase biotin carboxylase subunit [Chloroflexi bacterium]|nr:MAG: acetyl-CoA carboxylase biotin carboxylase subunit [Chloroflexota bacterium]
MPKLRKCLIANRGEIAVRIIHACRELDIATVAVYSEADSNARHVQLADEAYCIGEPAPEASYLRIDKLLDVAQQSGCDCVHPGYGFLAESAEFARAVLDAGLVWVGPPPEAIELMGVKTEARTLMEKADVPLVPGYQPESPAAQEDNAAFIDAAEAIGYPVMVKAAGGGGGKGIRVVYQPQDLPQALQSARSEARKAFGDARIFLEKYIETARHIEIQVLADTHGNTVHLFERECSAQRRHQKIIEESPSPLLDDTIRAQMGAAAVAAAQAVGYVNAGTVEFIATPDGQFYFLEMNTRIQVEHPVTELVTGQDLVQLQFRIAGGEALPFSQDDLRQQGHAIECRIYAEDAQNNFLPAIGPVLQFIPPQMPNVRVDSGIQSGDAITIHYDPMIAKIIVHAPTREQAIRRMQHALANTVILGTTTNIAFLQALLAHPVFLNGEVDTRFVDTHLEALLPPAQPLSPEVLIAAALHEMNAAVPTTTATDTDGDIFSPWAKTDGFRIGG